MGLGPIPYRFAGSNPAPRIPAVQRLSAIHTGVGVQVLGRHPNGMRTWLFLGLAIASEVTATASLKATEGFTKLMPSLVVLAGYSAAFYFLSLTLEDIPIGVAYAVWSGVGVAAIALISVVYMDQKIDLAGVVGMSLIVIGVIVLRLFSESAVDA